MFEIGLLDEPDFSKLLAGSDVHTGFNVELDIFTGMAVRDLSLVINTAYDQAHIQAQEKAETNTQDPEKPSLIDQMFSFYSEPSPPPLSAIDAFMQGPQGPPLGKARYIQEYPPLHPILQTYEERNYEFPQGDFDYSIDRMPLGFWQGNFQMLTCDTASSKDGRIPDDIHRRFGFKAKSYMHLPEFVLGMIDLQDNWSGEALQAKLDGVRPTTGEGMAQRDALRKLGRLFQDRAIPFYATVRNAGNGYCVLAYGKGAQ
jgi:hypothetical protein